MKPEFNTGLWLALGIILLSVAHMAKLAYQWRKDRLMKRERAVQRMIELGLYESISGSAVTEGFIFCKLWRASDIHREAAKIGIVLDLHDVYSIVHHIRKQFDPETGVNVNIIRKAIAAYSLEREKVHSYARAN
ncbi:MAG: hypothetical protein QM762_12455 [Chryseolinea sp.]